MAKKPVAVDELFEERRSQAELKRQVREKASGLLSDIKRWEKKHRRG